jgi:hypothetical protein
LVPNKLDLQLATYTIFKLAQVETPEAKCILLHKNHFSVKKEGTMRILKFLIASLVVLSCQFSYAASISQWQLILRNIPAQLYDGFTAPELMQFRSAVSAYGVINGHASLPDGVVVTTTPIREVSTNDHWQSAQVVTESGSHYELKDRNPEFTSDDVKTLIKSLIALGVTVNDNSPSQ